MGEIRTTQLPHGVNVKVKQSNVRYALTVPSTE